VGRSLALIVVGRIASAVIDGVGPLTVSASLGEILIVAILIACRQSLQAPAGAGRA